MSVCSPFVPDAIGRITVCADSGEYPTSATERYEGKVIWDVSLESLLVYDGSNWFTLAEPVQSWTPSVANLTVGAGGSWSAGYHRSDGWIDFFGTFTYGSGSAVGAGLTLTLPKTAASAIRVGQFSVGFYDSSVGGNYTGLCAAGTTTTVGLLAPNNATNPFGTALSSTVPFTWATGDLISFSGRYRLAARNT